MHLNVSRVALFAAFVIFSPPAWCGRLFQLGPNEVEVPNEFILRLKTGGQLATILSRYVPGAQVRQVGVSSDHVVIRLPSAISSLLKSSIAADSLVDYVEPNRVRRTRLNPNDPSAASQWALQNVQAAQAWGALPGRFFTAANKGNPIKVAVIDTGADCTHQDFANAGSSSTNSANGGQLSFASSQALVPTTLAAPACSWQDDDGHGTHVAGIIAAAANNGVGVAGLGYPVQLVIYKALDANGSGTDADIATAIINATNAGAQVISMSLSGLGYSQTLESAVEYAWQRNVLVVAAAGNIASNSLAYPAGATHAIGVAATDAANNVASFSSFGDFVGISAPGVAILSTMTTYPTARGQLNYASLTGTSMATPFVASLGALLAMTTPGVSADAIAQRIFQTASSPTANGGWDPNRGYGLIQGYNALTGVFRPSTSGAVRGQIRDSLKFPVSGQVTLNGQTVSTEPSSGLYRFPSVPPGTYSLSVTAPFYATQTISVTVSPGSDTVLPITMGITYGKITGTVTDSSGAVPNVIVQAFSGTLTHSAVVADTNGVYTLWLPAGSYTVRPSGMARTANAVAATVTAGGTTTLNLSSTLLGRIFGSVSSTSGATAGAQIVATGPSGTVGATSDAAGSYSTIRVPAGTYSLQATTATANGTVSGLAVNGDTLANIVVSQAASATVTSNPAGLAIIVDGSTCVTPCTFQWIAGSAHTVSLASPQAGSAGTRYTFVNWSDAGAQSHTINSVAGSTTYTANFNTQYFLTTSAIPVGGGSISPASGWFNSGPVSVSATAGSGYQFSSFTGALNGNTTPQTLSLSAPATVTANFSLAGASWYGAWSTRRKLTVDHTKVTGNLSSFPMLVSITDPDLKSIPNGGKVASATGADLVFTASDANTKLNHELESFDPISGKLVAWVQVPTLNPVTDAFIYLYYGNVAASDQQNKTGVWDGGYKIVNHFKDGSDSTQYANNATPSGGATPVAAGLAGPAYSVDGLSGQLVVPNHSSWNSNFSSYTVELWIKPAAFKDYAAVIAAGPWDSTFNAWFYASGAVQLRLDTTSGFCAVSGNVPLDNAFHQLVLTYDSALSQLNAYIDGVGRQHPYTCSGTVTLPATPLTIGRFSGGNGIAATIDELRISGGTPRSAAWITTGFNSQKSPGTFYAIGAPETNGSSPTAAVTIAANPAGRTITVDGVTCTTPCVYQWTASSAHTVAIPSPQAGTTGIQYAFASWSDGGAQSHTITAPASATTYTANFATQYLLTTSANPVAGGSISPASAWFNSGSVVAISATASGGYAFSGFTGALSGTPTPQNLTLNAPSTVAANFSVAGGTWYGAWTTRRKLTIDHTKVTGNLSSFPMLVSITDPELRSISNGGRVASITGADILFTASDAATKLNHEVESFDPVAGKVVAWVQVPALSPVTDTFVYLYYGSPAASDQQNRTGVWDSGYRIVNHLKDGSDSTQYGNNATPSGAATPVTGGLAGPAYNVDGLSGQLAVPFNTTWNAGFSSYTVELWIKPSAFKDYAAVLAAGGWGGKFSAWFYSTGAVELRLDTTSGYCAASGNVPLDNAFHQLVISYDSALSQLNAYIDGVGRVYPSTCTGAVAIGSAPLTIGRFSGGNGIAATLDELRISAGTPRSAAWITTGFNNQKTPGTFYAVGASETNGGGSPATTVTIASNPAGRAIVVDSFNCTSPCVYQWTPGSSHTVAITSPQAGTAGTQYAFATWSDGGAQSHTITAPASSTTYTANFTTQYFLTTAASPVAGGSISPSSGWFNSGSAVAISASVNSGYLFSSFSGALSGATTPQNLTMIAPSTVTANFGVAGGPWYGAGTTRRKLTVDHTRVTGNLSNFPVLVSITDNELRSATNGGKVASATGADIVFTASDASSKLNHELESYDPVAGKVVAWVQVPALNPVTDTFIYLYYGNAGAADQQNRTGVWDSGYKIVNHLKDGSDSTQFANHAIPSGAATPTVAGLAGSAYSVDGLTGQLTIPYSSSWSGNFSSYTVEFWIKPSALKDYAAVISAGGWGSTFNAWFYSTDTVQLRLDTSSGFCAVSGRVPLDNAFHQLVITYNSAQSQLNAYIDGVGRLYPFSCTGTVTLPALPLTIGRFSGGSGIATTIDEFRISAGTPRSAAWITTGFNNQSTPSTFYSVGASENNGGGASSATVTITSNPTGRTILVDGLTCTAPCVYQWMPNSSHALSLPSAGASQAGSAGTQYVFGNWSDGGAISHTISPSTSTTYTANFNTQYMLTTAAAPAAGGSISPGSRWFDRGSVVSVNATANSGYQFASFSGALSGTTSSGSLTLAGPATVTATFNSIGGARIIVGNGGNFQAALNSARPGDTIVLAAGATYRGTFTLPVKTGDGWITIESSDMSRVPAKNTRITRAAASSLPKIVCSQCTAIQAVAGAHHYRLSGLEIYAEGYAYDLISLGDYSVTSTNQQAHHFELEHLIVHGDATQGSKRGVALHASYVTVRDSILYDFKSNFQDAQAIHGYSGAGPYSIINNYLEASGENVMFGGSAPVIPNLVPTDIEVYHNHFYKPLAWKDVWEIKNLFELKNARNVRVHGNLFENNWSAAQNGFGILFTVRTCEAGNYPWAVVEDVDFSNNTFQNSENGIVILGQDDVRGDCGGSVAGQTSNIRIRNNFFGPVNRLFGIYSGARDITMEHNTAMVRDLVILGVGAPSQGVTYQNNLTTHGLYGVFGDGTATGTVGINAFFPGALFRGNILAGGNSANYPTGNFFPATLEQVGFMNLAGGDYSLALNSPFQGTGTDGQNPGANFINLQRETEGVVEGILVPLTSSASRP